MNIGGIKIDNYDKYKLDSKLIIKLVEKFYYNEHITVIEPQSFDFFELVINNHIKITILPQDTWISIKNNIDSKLSTNDNICRLCDKQIITKTTCNNCNKSCCIECYIDNFRKNKGIIKCDNCKYLFGVKTPDKYIELFIGDIRENARKLNKKNT